jgi:hypothetical protein
MLLLQQGPLPEEAHPKFEEQVSTHDYCKEHTPEEQHLETHSNPKSQ